MRVVESNNCPGLIAALCPGEAELWQKTTLKLSQRECNTLRSAARILNKIRDNYLDPDGNNGSQVSCDIALGAYVMNDIADDGEIELLGG